MMKSYKFPLIDLVRLLARRMAEFHISEFIERFQHWFPDISKKSIRCCIHHLLKHHEELWAFAGGFYRWTGK